MSTQAPSPKGSAFVPHDLVAPIHGARSGPLAGLGVAVKDTYDIEGESTGVGSPEWLATHALAASTAAAVRSLLDAGATIVGKTVCDEFVYSITGANAHYGTPINPRTPDRLPGGSSSGSASATAAGACDIGLGTDTGGSIRVPASLCGLHGIRPTPGRVDLDGVVPMAPSFDTAGWLTAAAGLLRLVGRVLLHGGAVSSEVRRVLLARDLLDAADPEVAEVCAGAPARAGALLPAPEVVVLAGDGVAEWVESFRVLQAFETWRTFGEWMRANTPSLGPGIDERMRIASQVTEAEAEGARVRCEAVRAHLRGLLTPGTVLLLPTTPSPAPPREAPAEALQRFRSRTMALTCVAGLGGLPQVTMPMATVDGAPVGISIAGWPGGDEALLDLACDLAVYCGR